MYRKSYFKDKVIILTGASSGIGLASAELFGRLGARLVLAARRASLLEEIAARTVSYTHLTLPTICSV